MLSSSPLAMLAWIGEKFLEWTDEDPPLDAIMASVSLYWLTDTFPRCIYPYRRLFERGQLPYISKPCGYSFFPKEVAEPRSWAAATANIVSYSRHSGGGHFAVSYEIFWSKDHDLLLTFVLQAMEKPAELLADVEEWVPKAWKGDSKL